MDELKEHQNTLIAIILATVAIVGALALVQKESANIRLNVLQPDTRIYKDSEPYTQTSQPKETVTLTLKEGEHTLLADADGRWPWKKDVRVTDDGRTKQWSVFLLPEKPPATAISPSDRIYQSIRERFQATTSLPTKSAPLISADERVSVWAQNSTNTTTIKAKQRQGSPLPAFCSNGECTSSVTSFETDADISHLQFFQDTNDLLIYAAGERVVVRELDPNGTQNIQPVFVGTAPAFRLGSSTRQVFIREEDGQILRLQL